MAAILATIESKLNEFLKPKSKDDVKDKVCTQAEKLTGLPRERIVSMAIMMIAAYSFFGTYFPFISHCICIFWPVKESFKVLRQQRKPSDDIFLYWILYAMISLFDYSFLAGFFYYVIKTGLFISFISNGFEKVREWSEPALNFTESWIFVAPPQPEVVVENH